MNKTVLALAVCAAVLSESPDGWRRILPAGSFAGVDGRPHGEKDSKGKPVTCKSWLLTPERGQLIVSALKQRQMDMVIDYEHQAINTAKNGQPAPAAGWMTDFEWRDDGLYALCQWTPKAQTMIDDKEYRYISPVFPYDPKTGLVNSLVCVALTNTPNLDGLTDLALTALSQVPLISESKMDPEILEQWRWMLNLPVGSTENDIKAQLQKMINYISNGQGMTANSVDLLALLQSKDQQIAALTQGGAVDPTKYVPISVVTALRQQLATLTQGAKTTEADELVTTALSDGRLLPAEEDWARKTAAQNLPFMREFLGEKPIVAALTQQQSRSTALPNTNGKTGLDAESLAVCSQLGITPEEFAKNKVA